MTVSSPSRMVYRPDIDGLRAIAVLAVVFYHADFTSLFGGGFIGVDIFFILSGYLITGIIHRECEAGTFRFLGFYERRIRRIVPAFFFMCAVCSLVAFLFISPTAFKLYGLTLMRAAVCMANFYFMSHTGGYFDAPSHGYPLLHTWSLSVEEQFYFIFPFIFLFIFKFFRRYLVPALLGIAVLSLGFSCVMVEVNQPFAFYMLPTRAWELLCGTLLALVSVPELTKRKREQFFGAGLGLLACSIVGYGWFPTIPFPGAGALLPCLGTMLCLVAGKNREPGGFFYTILTSRPFVWVGLISYSLYLWHWPVFVLYRLIFLESVITFPAAICLIIISIALATFSWKWVEQPFRVKRVLSAKAPLFAGGIAALCTLFFVGGSIYKVYIPSFIKNTPYAEAMSERKPDYQSPEEWRARLKEPFYFFGSTGQEPSIMVIGDSHAGMLVKTLDKLGKDFGKSGSLVACNPPFFGSKLKMEDNTSPYSQMIKETAEEFPAETVLIVARYPIYTNGFLEHEATDRERGLFLLSYTSPDGKTESEPTEALYYSMKEMIEYFRHNKVKNFFLLLPVPEQACDVPETANRLAFLGMDVKTKISVPLSDYDKRQADAMSVLSRLEKEYSGYVQLLDPVPALCPDGINCPGTEDGYSLYSDDDHLSSKGAMKLQGLLSSIFLSE